MDTIQLKHEIMLTRVNQEYRLLCDELVERNESSVLVRSIEAADRLLGYDTSGAMSYDVGLLIAREDDYLSADVQFHYGSGWAAADRLDNYRQRLDDDLIEVLRRYHWDEPQVMLVEEDVRVRRNADRDRRASYLAFACHLLSVYEFAEDMRRHGNFVAMRGVLTNMLDLVCNKRVEIVQAKTSPVTNPIDGPR